MQRFLTYIFLMITAVSWSQVENTMNNVPVESVEEEKEEISIEQEKIQTKREAGAESKGAIRSDLKNKQKKVAKKELAPAPAMSETKDVSVQSKSVESVSYGFTYSKQQSSVQRTQRSPSSQQQEAMDDAVDFFESNSPNTFEHHYYKYVAGNYNVELVEHLNKAEKLKPNNTDVQVQKAGYYMITGNFSKGIQYIDKLISSKRLSNSAINYAEDLLISAPVNGVLITHGFDDTYAAWYKQNKDDVREDVTLVSLDFLQSEKYRKSLQKKGYQLPNDEVIDVDYLEGFCKLNSDKNLSISLTTPKEYFQPLLGKLYVSGLVFVYSDKKLNNFSENEELWNNSLKKHLVNSATDQKAKKLSSNYLPMLLQLRSYYSKANNSGMLKEVDKAIDKIGVQSNRYEQVQKLKKAY